jgi:hypothetical protein
MEFNDLYSSQNTIRVIKSRRMRWVMHVARMVERTGAYRTLVGKADGRDHLKDPGVDGRVILRWIFRKWEGDMDWIDLAEKGTCGGR